jgi:hypothetical protein
MRGTNFAFVHVKFIPRVFSVGFNVRLCGDGFVPSGCVKKTLLKLLLAGIFGPSICFIFKNITFETSLTIIIKPRLRYWSHRVLSVLSISSHYYFVAFLWNFMENIQIRFDIHGSVHRRLLSRNTNKMQLCNRIYYSKVFFKRSTCFEWHTAHHQEL